MTHLVFGTRILPCTGCQYSAMYRFMRSEGTSDSSLPLLPPRTPMYASIAAMTAPSHAARRRSCSAVQPSSSSRSRALSDSQRNGTPPAA